MLEQRLAFVGVVLLIVMFWLALTSVLAILMGWYPLANRFPDRYAAPLFRLRFLSGYMGWISVRGILTLSVCTNGLRVGIARFYGPFCRNFFVPWDAIYATRREQLFGLIKMERLQFGSPEIGSLTISRRAARKLASAAMGHWPELSG